MSLKKRILQIYLVLLLVASFAAQGSQTDADFQASWRYASRLDSPHAPVGIPAPARDGQAVRLRLDYELQSSAVLQPDPDVGHSADEPKPLTLGNGATYLLCFVAVLLLFGLLKFLRVVGLLSSGRPYVAVRLKFIIALALAGTWTAFSIYLAEYWFNELSGHIGVALATLVIAGIAIVPGFMNAFLLASLLLDRRPARVALSEYPSLTVLIAAYNEAGIIAQTISSIERQQYSSKLEVIVIDDGSTDDTAVKVTEAMIAYPWLKLIRMGKNGGKANALNRGLAMASHKLIVTLDADSCLYQDALHSIVERYHSDPPNTRVVAGAVLVQNSRTNWVTRTQEWDYFHGIAAIKRVQSLFQGTLVAQGAFSLYDRQTLVDLGGWPNCVGEDIVLTWAILNRGYRVGHSEDACVFTTVPDTLKQFSRQRQRWSRGMIEAFKKHPGVLLTPRLSTFFIYWNLLFPLLDMVFTLFFIPGVILALFGYFWIVGPMTLALLPVGLAMNYIMYFRSKNMFDKKNLRVRANVRGFLMYAIGYSLIMQPVCLWGYLSEVLNLKKNWGTK
ncbi:MAG: glycosyltransferase family 2 protein [Pseudomonadota bacterium]